MVKNHLKTIAAPRDWPIERKNRIFVLRPSAGPHNLKSAVSLNFLIISMLKLAKTKKEVRYIVNNKEVLVDNKRKKDISLPVGLFDIITIKDIKKSFRVIMNKKGRIDCNEIDPQEANIKPYKITGKKYVKNKIQLNLFDGSNIMVGKEDYKVNDTIIMDLTKKDIKDHLKLEKGNTILLIGGKHMGEVGKIEDIIGQKIIYKMTANDIHETSKKYAFVLGKEKSIIKLK